MSVCYSPIDNCAVQVNRLDCDGNVLNGGTDVVVSCGLTDITSTPILGEERNNQDPNGQGGYCAERNVAANIEGYTVEITLCSKVDVELFEILDIFDPIIDEGTGQCIGYASKGCDDTECLCAPGSDTCLQAGTAIHLWHIAWLDKERHPDFRWVVEAFPKVIWDAGSVSITRNSEFNTYTVTGRAYCNDLYGQGPASIYPNSAGLGTYRGEWGTNVAPPNGCNCDVCGYAAAGTAVGN